MKLFMMAASAKSTSVNKKLVSVAAKLAKEAGYQVDLAQFEEFDLPLYNGDLDEKSGIPSPGKALIERMSQADGIVFSVPEYNFSVPGTFKNMIDWVSRAKPMPWTGKQILLLSASPSLVGGNRGLWATRIPLEGCGAFVFPSMFSLASAYEKFDEKGNLVEADSVERLKKLLVGFAAVIQKSN